MIICFDNVLVLLHARCHSHVGKIDAMLDSFCAVLQLYELGVLMGSEGCVNS